MGHSWLIFHTATAINILAQAQLEQTGNGRLDDVGGVVRSEGLAENIPNSDGFQNRADGLAGDQAGAGGGGAQDDPGSTVAAQNFVGDGGVLEGDADHVLFGHFAALADGFGDLDGFAEADTDVTVLVARDNEGAKTETATALDDFGGSVDENDFFA
jgi:hypothetical protein